MTATIAEPVELVQSVEPVRPVRPRELRPGRRTGRGTGPRSRPTSAVAPPRLAAPVIAARGCRVESPQVAVAPRAASTSGSAWRLTERGIALVLVTGLAIASAALAVVTLTALRVTGDGYAPAGQVQGWQR